MKNRRTPFLTPWALASAALFSAGAFGQTTTNVASQWNQITLDQIKATRPGPPVAARQLAIVHTCMFDAWAAYDANALGTRLGGQLRRPAAERTLQNKTLAASTAAYRCAADLFPARATQLAAAAATFGVVPANVSTDVATATGIGNTAAAAVLAFRATDGSNQKGTLNPGAYSDYTGYAAVNTSTTITDPNRWQPLPPVAPQVAPQKFIAPHWYLVTPFSFTSPTEFDQYVPGPALFPSDEYLDQAEDLVKISAALTDEGKAIVEYWADGPDSELPPGHWGLFGQWVVARDAMSIDDGVKFFFAVHNSSMDAGIVAWHLKRKFDYVRPITALRFLYQGQTITAWGGPGYFNPNDKQNPFAKAIDGATWSPYNPGSNLTPAFPEYTSGHSIFSRASADVMEYFTGSKKFGYTATFPALDSRVEPGFAPFTDHTWTYKKFQDAADQAGDSRQIGGIHFKDGDVDSRALGAEVAKRAWCKAITYFNNPRKHNDKPCKK